MSNAMSWRAYESHPRKPQPKHREPADMTAWQLAIADSLRLEDRERIHEDAKAYAAARLARFEMERGRK